MSMLFKVEMPPLLALITSNLDRGSKVMLLFKNYSNESFSTIMISIKLALNSTTSVTVSNPTIYNPFVETISRVFFKQVILRDVKSIVKGKRPGHAFSDFHRLLSVLPRTV